MQIQLEWSSSRTLDLKAVLWDLDITRKPLEWKESTLKALDIVLVIRSRAKPPAKVPNIPHMIVIPPNIRSALFCKKNQLQIRYLPKTCFLVLICLKFKTDNWLLQQKQCNRVDIWPTELIKLTNSNSQEGLDHRKKHVINRFTHVSFENTYEVMTLMLTMWYML